MNNWIEDNHEEPCTKSQRMALYKFGLSGLRPLIHQMTRAEASKIIEILVAAKRRISDPDIEQVD